MDIFARQLTGNIVISSVNKHRPDLPAELDQVVGRACAREPDDRYETAGDLAMDLQNVPPPEWAPPTLRDLPRALTPASLTPAGPVLTPPPWPVRPGSSRMPRPTPAPVEVSEVNPLPPAAFMLDEDDEHISVRKPGWRLWATIGALLALGGTAAYFLTAREAADAPPLAHGGQARSTPTNVVMKLRGAPIGARAYDLDHPAVPLPLVGDQLTLPRSEKAMRLRLEAPGYEKIQIEVIPEADGEINFGPQPPTPSPPPPAK
jgi:hypothetical protein